jgi:hypothetical protein
VTARRCSNNVPDQVFVHNPNGTIRSPYLNGNPDEMCLEIKKRNEVVQNKCEPNKSTQKWIYNLTGDKSFRPSDKNDMCLDVGLLPWPDMSIITKPCLNIPRGANGFPITGNSQGWNIID